MSRQGKASKLAVNPFLQPNHIVISTYCTHRTLRKDVLSELSRLISSREKVGHHVIRRLPVGCSLPDPEPYVRRLLPNVR